MSGSCHTDILDYFRPFAEDQLMIFADTECLAAIEQRLTDCKQIWTASVDALA